MSAFHVGIIHLSALVNAAIAERRDMNIDRFISPATRAAHPADTMLEQLLFMELDGENCRSLMARYPSDWQEMSDRTQLSDYRATVNFPGFGSSTLAFAVAVLKGISCYEYQSCEHGEWEQSNARRFCDALRSSMIHRLPGYDSAPWGLEEEQAETEIISLMSMMTARKIDLSSPKKKGGR